MGIAVNIGIILICSVFALLLLWLQQKSTGNRYVARHISPLGTFSWDGDHKRCGTTISAFNSFWRYSHVTRPELWWIYVGGAIVIIMLLNWSSLVLMTLQEDLAQAEGTRVFGVTYY